MFNTCLDEIRDILYFRTWTSSSVSILTLQKSPEVATWYREENPGLARNGWRIDSYEYISRQNFFFLLTRLPLCRVYVQLPFEIPRVRFEYSFAWPITTAVREVKRKKKETRTEERAGREGGGEREREREEKKRERAQKTLDLSLTTSLLIRAIHHEPAYSWP